MKKFRKTISLVLALIIVSQLLVVKALAVNVSAWGAIAIDGDTGEVLYEKNPDKMLVPASMTKIMTSYIIYQEIEAGNLSKDTMIKVSPRVARISRDRNFPMAVPLESGGEYSVDQLIKLIMIPSASASCIAVAEHISGSEAKFVDRMNKTAKEIGMEAKFTNSHGAQVHYTTPRGMAVLVKRFIDDYPDILNYTSLQGIDFNGKRYSILNKLMHSMRYEGVDGFKTGTIPAARYCLASTVKKDGRRVIATVFGSSSQDGRYHDSKKILDLAFSRQKNKDQARSKTKMDIINLPESIRIGSEYRPRIKFNQVASNYSHNGKFYLDGNLIKEVKSTEIKDGFEMPIPFVKEDRSGERLELKYLMEMPNGKTNTIVKSIDISQEAPALYKDIYSLELEELVKKLANEKIMSGLGNGYFGFKNQATRGDFVTILGRLVENQGLDKIQDQASIYQDVGEGDYYSKYVAWAHDKGLVEGYNNRFMPKDKLSLEEAASILDNFYKAYNIDLENPEKTATIDMENLSPWARESMLEIGKKDLLGVYGEIIDPKAYLSRGQLVDILIMTLDNLEEKEEINIDETA